MSGDVLQQVQQLQFNDKAGAEALLLAFIRQHFPELSAVAVELRPSAISLNSFNGLLTLANGQRRFFKTHTETDTIIEEYYHAELLENAGYPVIRPIFSSTDVGKQLLVYELIDSPSVFDVAWSLETTAGLGPADNLMNTLRQAQEHSDRQLLSLYEQTLSLQTAEEASQAAVHQLFYHRLAGGRLQRFYGPGREIALPGGRYSMQQIRRKRWRINGQTYNTTLDDIIERSTALLVPEQPGPSVIGHGDAHNGNVFLLQEAQPPSLLYFDPAFAGRHHPLLDLAKPLFHNVYAMWMYYPQEKRAQFSITLEIIDDVLVVEHDYKLHPVRLLFRDSKTNLVLIPLLQMLKQRGWLREDWRSYIKAALFCCPLLTMNLADSERFPPEISLLGLAMAIEMGAENEAGPHSDIDHLLDEAAAAAGV